MSETVLDSEARRRLAELARQLATGHITNDQFEDSLPTSPESALHQVFFNGLWPLYDDLHQHKLIGRYALTKEGRAWVARIVLFLRSNQPYRWPSVTGWRSVPVSLLSVFTLGWFGRWWKRRLWRHGEESVWPFYTRGEYEQALHHPVYLAAQQSTPADAGVLPK